MIPARIVAKLVPEPNTGCMLWEGSTCKKGYAMVKWQGRRMRVNRVLYKLRTGRWPSRRYEMLHSCDTPSCCNERHVRPGTRATNARERQERGRTRGFNTYRRAS